MPTTEEVHLGGSHGATHLCCTRTPLLEFSTQLIGHGVATEELVEAADSVGNWLEHRAKLPGQQTAGCLGEVCWALEQHTE
jgi:hypothetical protein